MITPAGWAWLPLLVACAPRGAAPPPVRCDHARCPPAYTCHYASVGSECRLETGRCNSELDCAPGSQLCQRFGPQPGVCVARGP